MSDQQVPHQHLLQQKNSPINLYSSTIYLRNTYKEGKLRLFFVECSGTPQGELRKLQYYDRAPLWAPYDKFVILSLPPTIESQPPRNQDTVPMVISSGIRDHTEIPRDIYQAISAFRNVVYISNFIWTEELSTNLHNPLERQELDMWRPSICSDATGSIIWLGPEMSDSCQGVRDLFWAINFLLPSIESSSSPLDFGLKQNVGSGIYKIPKAWKNLGEKGVGRPLASALDFLSSSERFDHPGILLDTLLPKQVHLCGGKWSANFWRLTKLACILNTYFLSGDIARSVHTLYGGSPIRVIACLNFLEALHHARSFVIIGGVDFGTFHDARTSTLFAFLAILRKGYRLNSISKWVSLFGLADKTMKFRGAGSVKDVNSLSIEEIYTHMTELALEGANSIGSICDTRRHSANAISMNLPSWVVDFSSVQVAKRIPPSPLFNFDLQRNKKIPKFRIQRPYLICYGACFDTIEKVVSPSLCKDFESFSERALAAFQLYNFCANSSTPFSQIINLDDLKQTLIFDSAYHASFSSQSDFEFAFHQFLLSEFALIWIALPDLRGETLIVLLKLSSGSIGQWRTIAQDFKTLFSSTSEKLKYFELLDSQPQKSSCDLLRKNARKFRNICRLHMRGRKLFKTRNGLLGVGLQNLQAGDELWVLRDAQTPFIMRRVPSSSDYHLVGDAFILGFMNGELMNIEGMWECIREIRIA